MTGSLDALLSPRVVAVVGASDNATRIGGRPLRYMRESGFSGIVYPVNPTRDTVQGLKSWPSIGELPQTPDVAILSVPADATEAAVSECVARGVKAAIVFSAGFAETGPHGAARQQRLVEIARAGDLRLLGPNCLGVMNPGQGFYGTFSVVLDTEPLQPGPIGIVSQSGAYGAHIAHLARRRRLGVSQWITTGNEADIDVAEALAHVVEDSETRVLMVYAEGVRNRDTFLAALDRARTLRKAVVFMKTGRSAVGAQAAASHTAALAGSDAVFDAILRQYGVWRAASTAEQIDIAYACARGIYPEGARIGIFTMSGGFGIQLADDAEANGLDVSPMPEDAQQELKELLPYCSPRNPVDATAQAVSDFSILTRCVASMMTKGGYDIFAGIFGSGPATKTFAEPLRAAILKAFEGRETSVKALTMSAPPEIVASYEQEGFLVYEDGSILAKAMGALVRFRKNFDAAASAEAPAICPVASLPEGALSEHTAKRILAEAGISFPPEILVAPGEDTGLAAERLGLPVVLKISSPDIPHKTEVGGVAVNIRSAEEARERAAQILARAQEKAPRRAHRGCAGDAEDIRRGRDDRRRRARSRVWSDCDVWTRRRVRRGAEGRDVPRRAFWPG